MEKLFLAVPHLNVTRRCLEVPVLVLIWVNLRRVRGELKQFDPVPVPAQPGGDHPGVMHGEVVNNQEDIMRTVFEQRAHESDQQVSVHRFFDGSETD